MNLCRLIPLPRVIFCSNIHSSQFSSSQTIISILWIILIIHITYGLEIHHVFLNKLSVHSISGISAMTTMSSAHLKSFHFPLIIITLSIFANINCFSLVYENWDSLSIASFARKRYSLHDFTRPVIKQWKGEILQSAASNVTLFYPFYSLDSRGGRINLIPFLAFEFFGMNKTSYRHCSWIHR